ncbi:hypothetical protein F0562_019713 [Nyssa sinensis]|uniref:Zinc finger PMZ-type domain-containing protein n=1 Tax=Nyssa sinensis TaxID=561372 RepID=A0A5J5BT15_9ASTE|nr:hypothetical protein F0562_019713 [Nyssa sinensis]
MLLATSSLPATRVVHIGTADCNDNMSDSEDVEDYSEDFESDDDVEYDPSIDDSSSSEEGSVRKSTCGVFDQNLYGNEFNVKEGSKIVLKWTLTVGNVFMEHGKLGGLPCKHAAAAIGYKRGNIEGYCDDVFSKDKYLAAYKHILHPIADPKMWRADTIVGDPIQSPYLRRLLGRP